MAWDISFVFGLLQIPHMTQKTFEGQCRHGSYRILRLWAVAQQVRPPQSFSQPRRAERLGNTFRLSPTSKHTSEIPIGHLSYPTLCLTVITCAYQDASTSRYLELSPHHLRKGNLIGDVIGSGAVWRCLALQPYGVQQGKSDLSPC